MVRASIDRLIAVMELEEFVKDEHKGVDSKGNREI